ncbi:hypothetical protein THRCLA_21717 [Thraustotheca clavata]|uniref:M96 mating-specific protein family n=1 Tax=Thraustotheca clavata TaxID=74557 RepID=A0A1V9ZQE2_9STRA|nr:hypothetical protein THRCLA_21717 [Thraustotheca clavata]
MNDLTLLLPDVFPELLVDHDMSTNIMSDFLSSTIDFGKPSKRSYQRPKEALDELRAQEKQLLQQLQNVKFKKQLVPINSRWKTRAIEQAQCAHRARLENKRLRELVQGQIEVIQSLDRLLKKQEKIPKTMIGVLQIENRQTDLEALMKYLYDQIELEWIRHRLHDAREKNEEIVCTFTQSNYGDYVKLHNHSSVAMPLNYIAMSNLLWNHNLSAHHPVCEVLNAYHEDLLYLRENFTSKSLSVPTLESRHGMRRYIEPNRVVFLWHSIMDDALQPHEKDHLICNRTGIVILYPKGKNECTLQTYITMSTPTIPDSLQSTSPSLSVLNQLIVEVAEAHRAKFGPGIQKLINLRQRQITCA